MRIDLLKSSYKALVIANKATLVSGLVLAEKIPQWEVAQVTTSVFTPYRPSQGQVFIGIGAKPTAESSKDSGSVPNIGTASGVSGLLTHNLYDVELRVITLGSVVSGESQDNDEQRYEQVNRFFDLLVARVERMLRDNASFSSTPSGFTIELETEIGSEKTQRITIADFSAYAPWGEGGNEVAAHINAIRFRATTCGEPEA